MNKYAKTVTVSNFQQCQMIFSKSAKSNMNIGIPENFVSVCFFIVIKLLNQFQNTIDRVDHGQIEQVHELNVVCMIKVHMSNNRWRQVSSYEISECDNYFFF